MSTSPLVDKTKLFMLADLACRLSKKQRLLAEGHVLEPLRPIDEVGQAAGYKPNTAAAVLRLPKVQAYVEALLQSTRGEERLAKHFNPVLMGVNEALGRLALIARSGVGDHVTKDETGRLTTRIDLENSYAIKELKLHEYVDMAGGLHTETTFKMEDKKPALELILKAHGVFLDDADKRRVKDAARERIWRTLLLENPELAKKAHLQLLAIDEQADVPQVIELQKLPVPSNGHGAAL